MTEEQRERMKRFKNLVGSVSFPKGLREANYDYEAHQSNIINKQDAFIEFLLEKLPNSREELENEFNEHIKNNLL